MPHEHDINIPLEMVQRIQEYILRSLVESGDIEIGDRSPEQVFEQFYSVTDTIIDSRFANAFHAIDHRATLIDRAKAEAEAKNNELAVTLYAIWIEHFINGVLTRAFERMGYDEKVSLPLVKELRLQTKTTALWTIVGLPAIGEESLKLINQIAEFRNAFVHYKWHSTDFEAISHRENQLRAIVARAEGLMSDLLALESSIFWKGREKEIIEHLYEDLKRAYQERGLLKT